LASMMACMPSLLIRSPVIVSIAILV